MLGLALASALAVRAELVEARAQGAPLAARPPTSSGRTDQGSVIDAEWAFAATAMREGQWTAFRAYAAPDATMFVPQPVNAQAWLKDRKDPPRSVNWWPTAVFLSCDGSLAVNRGGWRRPDGSVGFFTTVWRRETDGRWRWILDDGDKTKAQLPRPASPVVTRAFCAATKPVPAVKGDPSYGAGASADGSLLWEWGLNATGKTRVFSAYVWDGKRYADAFEDLIAVE